MGEDSKEYSFTLKGINPTIEYVRDIYEPTLPEYETDYILEEDMEELRKYIERLQNRITELKMDKIHLLGKCEVWEKMWRIWNGEKHE